MCQPELLSADLQRPGVRRPSWLRFGTDSAGSTVIDYRLSFACVGCDGRMSYQDKKSLDELDLDSKHQEKLVMNFGFQNVF